LKKRQIDKQVARFSPHYQWWKKHLGLEEWDITVTYFDGPFSKKKKGDDNHKHVVADVSVWWEYRRAVMRVNLRKIREVTDERRLEYIAVHELMHVKLNEMRHYGADDGIYHEERTATDFGNAFMWVKYAGEDA
jgi:hypothetical protein